MSVTPLWTPAPERARASQMHAFLQAMAGRHALEPTWEALRTWALEQYPTFWAEWLAWAGVTPSTPAAAPCEGAGLLDTRWFPGLTLNYARYMLRTDNDDLAIISETEDGRTTTWTHRELRQAVARCTAALQAAGVRRGDRIAGYLPNVGETVIAMLATASCGAIWSSCSPDFGVQGVLDRFGQIAPKLLFATDSYSYGGRIFDVWERVVEILPRLREAPQVVVIPRQGDGGPPNLGKLNARTWRNFLDTANADTPLHFEEVPFDHPLFIMYSSGTTGVPKCIVHGHGGTLLQHLKELMLHCDLRAGERIFYFTTCGWMMWNWLVSSLGVGAAVVLYDGNPAFPDVQRLWRLTAREHVTVFGTSPKFLAACEQAGAAPGREHDLTALRCLCSTGSPLSPDQFRWVYDHVKRDLQLASISGGTDIISCFMLGNPLLPVYAGEIQCRGLGMDVQAWDENGAPVVGQKGELVCCTPFPSQPVGFWNDPGGARYRDAYFEHYPERCVWHHGDFIEITPRGGVIVYGRSDATLNPGGVRIGTAEIYRVVENIPEVTDSLVVGRDTPDGDVEICLFLVLRAATTLDKELTDRIRTAIAHGATKRHVPRHIRQVTAIPYTISGKKVELAVRQILHGQSVPNRDALANPQVLDEYRDVL